MATRRTTKRKAPVVPKPEPVQEIHNELARTYEYSDDFAVCIKIPVAMQMMSSYGMVAIWDNRGALHVIPSGWRYLRVDPLNVAGPPIQLTEEQIDAAVKRMIAQGDLDEEFEE